METSLRGAALVAAIATALLFSACGGSEERVESTATEAAPKGEEDRTAGSVERQANEMPADRPPSGKQQNDRQPREEGGGADSDPKVAADRGEDGQPETKKQGNTKAPAGCPKSATAEQCAEAGRALENSGGSRPVPADGCPRAIDAATCEQAGQAYADTADEGRTLQPGECPRAMTAEQCRLAGEAYAAATR